MNNIDMGLAGENLAAVYLETKGHNILCRGFRTKVGEIDLITEEGSRIHFVEVKTRTGTKYGRPGEAVTKEKLKRIRNGAEVFLSRFKEPRDTSIDVAEIIVNYIPGVE